MLRKIIRRLAKDKYSQALLWFSVFLIVVLSTCLITTTITHPEPHDTESELSTESLEFKENSSDNVGLLATEEVTDVEEYEPSIESVEPFQDTELVMEDTESPTEEINLDSYVDRYIVLTEDEMYTMATLVYLEAGNQSYECQLGVASVILNRMTSRNMALNEVIYEQNQFSPAAKISTTTPSQSAVDAVHEVCFYGPTMPECVLYFRAWYYHKFATPYIVIDDTYFSYDSNKVNAGEDITYHYEPRS